MRILTFNVFDLPPVRLLFKVHKTLSEDRLVRLPKILEVVQNQASASSGWDVLFLQELWSGRFRRLFREYSGYRHSVDEMEQVMPEHLSVFKGAKYGFGHGLMILSRFPVLKTWRLHFSENGKWRHLDDGEVSVKKGAIAGLIDHPELGKVVLVNSHMVARYEDHQYIKQRMSQFEELVNFCCELKSAEKKPLILGGDLNFGPWLGPDTKKLRAGIDLFEKLKKTTYIAGKKLICSERAYELPRMATYCGKNNFYVDEKLDGQQIIDHIFCTDELRVESPHIQFDRPMTSGEPTPYSDHYALEVKIEAND